MGEGQREFEASGSVQSVQSLHVGLDLDLTNCEIESQMLKTEPLRHPDVLSSFRLRSKRV